MLQVWYIILSLFACSTFVESVVCTDSCTDACNNLLEATAKNTVACAPTVAEFLKNIQCCNKEHSDPMTCEEGICVVKDRYHINGDTPDSVSLSKANKLLDNLNKKDPATKPLNELIRLYCVKKKYYLKFPDYPHRDPDQPVCISLKYMHCALFYYWVGQNTSDSQYQLSEKGCATIANYINDCSPCVNTYVPSS